MVKRRFLLTDTIEESQWILELEDNWDGNDALSYGKVTWDRASKLVEKIYIDGEIEYQLPRILPGPDRSIDLHWKSSKYEALANIPHDVDGLIELYGHDANDIIIVSGRFSDKECISQVRQFFGRLNDLKGRE